MHSFTAILERRRNAGMEWVEKGRGVRFVSSGTVPVFNTVPETGTVPFSGTVPETGTDPVLKTGTVSVPDSGTPLGSIRNIEEITSSSSVAAVSHAARKYGIVLDDDAARKLVRRCRAGREDATDDELSYFTELKINQLKTSRTVENWVGMLIASVPVYFEGRATELHRYRAEKEREAEQGREAARAIIADPEASRWIASGRAACWAKAPRPKLIRALNQTLKTKSATNRCASGGPGSPSGNRHTCQ